MNYLCKNYISKLTCFPNHLVTTGLYKYIQWQPLGNLYHIRKPISVVNLQSFKPVTLHQSSLLCHIVAFDCIEKTATDPRAGENRSAFESTEEQTR